MRLLPIAPADLSPKLRQASVPPYRGSPKVRAWAPGH